MVIARPLIILLYGAKWATSSSYFQILCLGGVFFTMNSLNVTIIKALGKGKVFFVTQVTKRVLSLALIFFSFILGKKGIIDGVLGLIWAVTISNILCVVINTFVNKKLIHYGILSQLKDVFPYLFISTVLALFCVGIKVVLPLNQFVLLFIQFLVFVLGYIILVKVFKVEGYETYRKVLITNINKFIRRKSRSHEKIAI